MSITDVVFIVFLLWGIPMSYYRSRFRKLVYHTDSWTINIKPVFGRELKALFGNMYPDDAAYLKFRNWYRLYLIVYILLLLAWQLSKRLL